MNSVTYKNLFHKTPIKIFLLLSFLVSVNLLSGAVAVWLRFPTLWGNSRIFFDYAMPLGMTWASAHLPSMILVSIALLSIPHWDTQKIQRFRIICLLIILILIYGVLEKIPFALFPAVDLFVAFFFSLLIVPPSYQDNPKFTIGLSIFLVLSLSMSSYILFSKWQHRTPVIKETYLMNGLFKLNAINVNYRELIFKVELAKMIKQDSLCDTALEITSSLFDTYHFDESYKKIVKMTFNPTQTEVKNTPYHLGVLEQYEKDGKSGIYCFLKYK